MEKLVLRREVVYIEYKLFDQEGRTREAAEELKSEFTADMEAGNCNYWLDISCVANVSSVFLGTIAYIINRVDNKGRVVISGCNDVIKQQFVQAGEGLRILNSLVFTDKSFDQPSTESA